MKLQQLHAAGDLKLKTVTALVGFDGAFEFPGVLPGSYEVRFDPSFDSAQRLLGVDGKGLSNLRIRAFIPTFRVTGTFQDVAELQGKSETAPHGALGPSVRLNHQDQEELLYRNLVRIVRGEKGDLDRIGTGPLKRSNGQGPRGAAVWGCRTRPQQSDDWRPAG